MNLFAGKILTSLITTALIGSGAGYVYYLQTPKTLGQNLEWNGYKLISGTEEEVRNIYKAMYVENKAEIKEKMGIENSSDYADDNLADSFKKACEKELNKEITEENKQIIEKLKKFCINSIKTVKGKLIKKGINNFSSTDKDWKISFTLNKNVKEFSAWIGEKDPKNHESLKKKCEKVLNSLNDKDIKKAEWWCVKEKNETISDLIKNKNNGRIEVSDWKKAKENWSNNDKYKEFLGNQEDDENGEKLKSKCEESKSKSLEEENVFEKTWTHVFNFCLTEQKTKSL